MHTIVSERHLCAHYVEWETFVCTLCLVRDIDVHMILSKRHTCFNRHFPNEPELAGIYWSKGWLRCWWQLDYWSYKSCKAPVKSSAPTNQHPVFFYRPDALLSTNQQCQSTEGKISHSRDLLIPSSPGVFQLCLWPLIAPGYLGEGCDASHQPSDASTPRYWSTGVRDTGVHIMLSERYWCAHYIE